MENDLSAVFVSSEQLPIYEDTSLAYTLHADLLGFQIFDCRLNACKSKNSVCVSSLIFFLLQQSLIDASVAVWLKAYVKRLHGDDVPKGNDWEFCFVRIFFPNIVFYDELDKFRFNVLLWKLIDEPFGYLRRDVAATIVSVKEFCQITQGAATSRVWRTLRKIYLSSTDPITPKIFPYRAIYQVFFSTKARANSLHITRLAHGKKITSEFIEWFYYLMGNNSLSILSQLPNLYSRESESPMPNSAILLSGAIQRLVANEIKTIESLAALRSWRDIVELDERIRIGDIVDDRWGRSIVVEFPGPIYPNYSGDELQIVGITSQLDLDKEGCRMMNCVALYGNRIYKGVCSVYSVKYKSIDYTLQVNNKTGSMVELKGLGNQRPCEEATQAISDWLRSARGKFLRASSL